MPNQVPAIEADGLTVKFPVRGGVLGKVKSFFTAVDGVSFVLPQGEILSIVGESGCGKSTLVKSLVGLVPVASGEFKLFGKAVHKGYAGSSRVCDLMQMVFQDPFSSLNPRQTVTEILTAPLCARGVPFAEAEKRARELWSACPCPPVPSKSSPTSSRGDSGNVCASPGA